MLIILNLAYAVVKRWFEAVRVGSFDKKHLQLKG